MSTSKQIDRICCVILAFVIILTAGFAYAGRFGVTAISAVMGYEKKLFDTTRVHTIDLVMDDWEGFLDTCENEEYECCSVVIDKEAYKNVAIRAKGNTSLSMVSKYGNDRYSFKIEFDHYDHGKTYYGLDKLSLNNIIQDNTYCKDYLSYQMMGYFGADAPLCSYVYITVNGEDWGLYLAVEGVEESFLERNYGKDYGNLYKPDSTNMGGGRGNGGAFDIERISDRWDKTDHEEPPEMGEMDGMEPPEMGEMNEIELPEIGEMDGIEPSEMGEMDGMEPPEMGTMDEMEPPEMGSMDEMEPPKMGAMDGMEPPEIGAMDGMEPPEMGEMDGIEPPEQGTTEGTQPSMPRGGFFKNGKGGMQSDDVCLNYTDDNYESYNNIFENAKTDITDADKDRLIQSLKAVKEGTELTEVIDTDEVIRYFVVHNFVCNFDSYTGSMVHNYYLYEEDGQLSMIPWDYNLAFGGFQSQADADGLVNYPIDTPVSGGEVSSRPMLAWMLGDEQYLEQYHQYFSEFIAAYFESGTFAKMYDQVTAMIAPYVEKDPTKFCTYEQFETGAAALKQFCLLRAESIRGQLDGVIPSTAEGQKQDSTFLVDASSVTISDMGSMGNGMGRMPDQQDRAAQKDDQGL